MTSNICKFAWNRSGVIAAADRGDMVVVVDALRFSTAVATAVHNGGSVRPCISHGETAAFGGAGAFSLSPSTLVRPGASPIPLYSLNGAACTRAGEAASRLLVGAFVNADATAAAVVRLIVAGQVVTVVACGELRSDGSVRFAVEDYLAAGAILAGLPFEKTQEAGVCAESYRQSVGDLSRLILGSQSGRELIARRRADDVAWSVQVDVFQTAVLLSGGLLIAA